MCSYVTFNLVTFESGKRKSSSPRTSSFMKISWAKELSFEKVVLPYSLMTKTALEACHSHFAFSLTLHPLKTEDIETVK